MAAEEFVLRWNNHQQNFAAVVEDLWRQDTFTDVILCSEGRVFPAHRVILSACSPYFLEILSKVPEHQHPVVFLQGVPLKDLHSLLTFMYSGEVVVSNNDMASFFRTAENLQIKGLASSSCPFTVAPEPLKPMLSGGKNVGVQDSSNLTYPNRPSGSPIDRRTPQRPSIFEPPLEPITVGRDSPKHQPRNIPIPRDTSPQPARPPVGLVGPDHASQQPSMLLSSLMGSRYSPPQGSRLVPAALPSGLSSPSGRGPILSTHPAGPDGPWVPRQPVPLTPRMPTYTSPGPSFSRRGRPPSDVTAPRQESTFPSGITATSGSETRPAAPTQTQVLRVTVVTPQGPVTMFQCPYCGKRFRRRDHLRQHIRTHTGEKPFQCNICGRRFSQSQQVRIHMRVHSDPSGTPPLIPTSTSNQGNQHSAHQGRGRGHASFHSSFSEASVAESEVGTVLSSQSSLSTGSQESPRTSSASSPPIKATSPAAVEHRERETTNNDE